MTNQSWANMSSTTAHDFQTTSPADWPEIEMYAIHIRPTHLFHQAGQRILTQRTLRHRPKRRRPQFRQSDNWSPRHLQQRQRDHLLFKCSQRRYHQSSFPHTPPRPHPRHYSIQIRPPSRFHLLHALCHHRRGNPRPCCSHRCRNYCLSKAIGGDFLSHFLHL